MLLRLADCNAAKLAEGVGQKRSDAWIFCIRSFPSRRQRIRQLMAGAFRQFCHPDPLPMTLSPFEAERERSAMGLCVGLRTRLGMGGFYTKAGRSAIPIARRRPALRERRRPTFASVAPVAYATSGNAAMPV